MNKLFSTLLFCCYASFLFAQTTSSMTNQKVSVTTKFNGAPIATSEMSSFGLTAFDVNNRANVTPTLIEVFQSNPFLGSYMMNNEMGFYDAGSLFTEMKNQEFSFLENVGFTNIERMKLTNNGLTFINGGNWTSIRLANAGSAGKLTLFAGGGTGEIFEVGPDPSNATRGKLILKDSGDSKIEAQIFAGGGYIETFGANGSRNAGLAYPSGRPDVGYVYVQDDNGQIQAGIIVNADGTGSVFGDTKNFRIPHPEKSGEEIWYASLEGPEAAAYERGTAELANGRIFVPFSDHFKLVINHKTLTIQLTPRHSDTYGLAIIKTTKDGFWVEELKGGNGNFSFDWNATGVRKGHEDYRVIRPATEMVAVHTTAVESLANNNHPTENETLDIIQNNVKSAEKTSFLKGNRPNPFSKSTIIDYQLPTTTPEAILIVTNLQGKPVQEHILMNGAGTVEIDASNLPKGMYNYSLVIDGQVQETKRMVVQ